MKPRADIPAIGEETIPTDEPAQIEALLAILRSIQEVHDRKRRPVPRNVHSKQHGCVHAELTIESALAAEFRHGVLREPRTHQALVRFSNSKQRNDELPDAHGMAIKLLDVEGEKLLEQDRRATTQDFVLVDHPVFFARNVAEMIPLAEDFRRLMTGGIFAKARTVLKAAISRDHRFRLLRRMAAKRPASPLAIQYWSTTPLKLGEGAMKISLRPERETAEFAAGVAVHSRDKLRLAMAAHLRERAAHFDFLVQRQIDPLTMPIEDPTVAWNEGASPWVKVATLRIQRQNFDSAERQAFGEQLSFTPWHSVPEHRPLGGINRARRTIYEAMSRGRHELNEASKREPTLAEVQAIFAAKGE